DRVRPGGEDAVDGPARVQPGRLVLAGRRARPRDRELDLRALAPADPVLLRLLRGLGPVDPCEVVQQALREAGDLEEPLLEQALVDGRAAARARARDHPLVREHRMAARAAVDRRLLLLR